MTASLSVPRRIPLFPLPGVVLMPGTMLPLHIFEPRYRAMVADALAGDRTIGMAMLYPGWEAGGNDPRIYALGGAGEIVESEELEDGRYNIVLLGTSRFRLMTETDLDTAYRNAEVETEMFDLRQQERSAKDVLARTDVVAPVDGIVMDLKVHTTGGVAKPGETLMTVVPLGQQLVVQAMVRPEDVETIAPGQPARVSFPAFARYNLPPLDGVVEIVSADRMVDERSGAPYFAATVLIDKSELAKLEGRKLLPGMSSEAMIRTGARTVLSYLAEPITQNFRRAMREK